MYLIRCVVAVLGSGFALADTGCTISSSPSGLISNPSCAVSAGTVSGSFTVASGASGQYMVTVTGTTGDASSTSFTVTTQYQLTMQVNPSGGGSTNPAVGSYWYGAGSSVSISASPATGFVFQSWTGSGLGSYSGSSNPASITMNSAITEVANFNVPGQLNVVLRTMSAQPVVRNVLIQICADLYCSSVIKSESFTVSLSASSPVTKYYLVLTPPNTFHVMVNWGTSPTNFEQSVTFGSSPQTVTFMEGSTGPPRPG